MKKHLKFEVYESYSKKRTAKKYLVTDIDAEMLDVMAYATKFFHCSVYHINFIGGYIYKGELYLEDPEKRGTKPVLVAHYVR